MAVLDLLKYFIPQDRKFFPLFDKAAANVHEGGKAIYSLVTSTTAEERIHYIRLIEKLEHHGDEITHEIFTELGLNFITPFDREDIHRLVTAIDDIIDFIYSSSKMIDLYNITNFDADVIKLAELIQQSTGELHKAISELKNMKKKQDIKSALVRINSIENHAEDIYDHALAALFKNETNAINLIMHKEILFTLETATDKCEDAANVIESIMIKMA